MSGSTNDHVPEPAPQGDHCGFTEVHDIWIEQCKAAEEIKLRGLKAAFDYLVAEKLLNFAETGTGDLLFPTAAATATPARMRLMLSILRLVVGKRGFINAVPPGMPGCTSAMSSKRGARNIDRPNRSRVALVISSVAASLVCNKLVSAVGARNSHVGDGSQAGGLRNPRPGSLRSSRPEEPAIRGRFALDSLLEEGGFEPVVSL